MNKDVRRFLRLPLGWRETDEIAGVSPTARDLLVTLVEYCQVRRNGGVMNELQVRTICRTMERGHWALAQLVSAGVLTMSVSEANPPQTLHTPSTNPPHSLHKPSTNHPGRLPSVRGGFVEGLWRDCTRLSFVRPSYWFISAGQRVEDEPRAGTRVRSRVKELERVEEERTPSGSVRSSSARDVPRSASGATRPVPTREDQHESESAGDEGGDLDDGADRVAEDGPPMRKSDALKAIRKAIGKSSKNSGQAAPLRRYPLELNSMATDPPLPVELNGRYE